VQSATIETILSKVSIPYKNEDISAVAQILSNISKEEYVQIAKDLNKFHELDYPALGLRVWGSDQGFGIINNSEKIDFFISSGGTLNPDGFWDVENGVNISVRKFEIGRSSADSQMVEDWYYDVTDGQCRLSLHMKGTKQEQTVTFE